MDINKFHIYLADLNPRHGTEPRKTRPVVVVQTDLLNKYHPSTVVCPMTTNTIAKSSILRIHLKKEEYALKDDSDIIVDQIRAIDNKRLIKHLGELGHKNRLELVNSLRILFFE
jgi:mRNA interferase MazF